MRISFNVLVVDVEKSCLDFLPHFKIFFTEKKTRIWSQVDITSELFLSLQCVFSSPLMLQENSISYQSDISSFSALTLLVGSFHP